jgi:hypothetical protein
MSPGGPVRQIRLFLSSLNVYKFGLWPSTNHSILSGFVGQEGGREGQLFKYIQEKENNIILLSKQEQGMIRIICFVVSANK